MNTQRTKAASPPAYGDFARSSKTFVQAVACLGDDTALGTVDVGQGIADPDLPGEPSPVRSPAEPPSMVAVPAMCPIATSVSE
jgi:hypothetical protein